jgi:hypothetical protein
LFGFALLVIGTANASLISTAPVAGTTTTFSGGTTACVSSCSGTDAGFSIAITGNGGVFNYDHSFGLVANGSWNPGTSTGFGMIGDGSGASTVTVSLGGGYSSVGGFMNYSITNSAPTGPNDPTISAIAADGTTVLETDDLALIAPISTPGGVNAGSFRGITLSSNSIYYFRITGSFIVEHDINLFQTVSGSPVPEPASAGLLASGIVFALYRLKRRK